MLRDLRTAILTSVFTVLFAIVAVYLFPWSKIKIGSNPLFPKDTITVTGESQGKQTNQKASFYASISSNNDDKQKALDEVNTKMTSLITELKTLGIPAEDIQTQNLGVNEKPVSYPVPVDTTKKWTANNTITVTVNDTSKVQGVADLLTINATNVSGPNYTVDNTTDTQADTLAEAIGNAKKKAEKIAAASGRTLGNAIKIDEGGNYGYPIPLMERSGTVSSDTKTVPPVEPGSQTVYKTVTVTFELK